VSQSEFTFTAPDTKVFVTIQAQFSEFHRLNPWVYTRLVKLAREMLTKGRTSISIGMLWEVLRWQYYSETVDPNSRWQLNNNYRSRYARLIAKQEADLKDVFETRKLTAD